MQSEFRSLADFVGDELQGDEQFLASFSGEESDFVRFNQSRIRQAGHVCQRELQLDLVDGPRHASGSTTLGGTPDEDRASARALLERLRGVLPSLPEDPHMLYSTEATCSESLGENTLLAADEATDRILTAGEGRDLVGIYAAGAVHRGFASSFGARHWFTSHNFNLDWSSYLRADKAVKSGYAGLRWDQGEFEAKVADSARQLEALERQPRTLSPGHYRVYLAPAAVGEYLSMLAWGGWGLKSHETKQTSLLKMLEEGVRLNAAVSIREDTAEGVAPAFQGQGFTRPDSVELIRGGELVGSLISPRSAKEYGRDTNGANADESPESVDVAAGELPRERVLAELDRGIWIGNLWYLNYSDRTSCRITGMTRFACFWVEGGEIVAPINVMRFDETVYRAFGEKLIGLTSERDLILDPGTYGSRSTDSARVPGALIDDFHFNL